MLFRSGWVDLVFEGKNQAYGAYQLRKNTGKRNMWSIFIMLIAAAVIAAVVGANAIISAANEGEADITADVNLSALAEKKPEVEEKAPVKIEEAKPVEQVKSSIKFVPPVVKEDKDVQEDKELKSQDELAETKTAIGGFDVKGNTDDADAQAYYFEFYDVKNVFLFGRVLSFGGDIIVDSANKILKEEFSEYSDINIILPSESERRVGQSLAVAII